MADKAGRPVAENPKQFTLTVRLDADTEARLRAYCEKRGISRGEAIRRSVYLLLEENSEGTIDTALEIERITQDVKAITRALQALIGGAVEREK
jgi:hypothetical protein